MPFIQTHTRLYFKASDSGTWKLHSPFFTILCCRPCCLLRLKFLSFCKRKLDGPAFRVVVCVCECVVYSDRRKGKLNGNCVSQPGKYFLYVCVCVCVCLCVCVCPTSSKRLCPESDMTIRTYNRNAIRRNMSEC